MTASLSSLRRRAAKLGYRFTKTRWRRDSADNLGGHQIIDVSRNAVVDGSRFDCSLEDVAAFIERQEQSA